jgi:quercetin 2,3-dioxygenase
LASIHNLGAKGSIGCDNMQVSAGQAVWLNRVSDNRRSEVELGATSDKHLQASAGRQLRETVVARGPFVMNTEQQIRDAYADYQ